MNLTLDERTKIFDKVCRLVDTKHFNPAMNGVDWNALVRSRRDQILACDGAEAFEKEVHKLVAELKTSHTGFRHAGMRNIPARHAINATLQRFAVNGTERWMFQDVHRGGPAYLAGIRPGDLLLGTGEREIRPPEDLTFSAGGSAELAVEKLHGDVEWVKLRLPMPKSKKHPVTAPEAVHAEMLTDEIGLDRVVHAGRTTNGMLQYIGEWHSHPNGYGVAPSGDDRKVFEWITEKTAEDGYQPVMAIVGELETRWFVESINSKQNVTFGTSK